MRIQNPISFSLRRIACAAVSVTTLCLSLCASGLAQTDTTIYSFSGGADGATPAASLIADASGNYYGTTYSGGSYAGSQCEFLGCGTVFELSPNGSGGWAETVLYTFSGGADGAGPGAGLVFDTHGNLYGTAYGGGINTSSCQLFTAPGCGVIFELSPNGSGGWTESVLYSFKGGTDGWDNQSALTFDSAGNLYGTTSLGGPTTQCNGFGCGEVFKLTPNGTGGWNYSVIHFFTNGKDGGRPFNGLVIDAAGNVFTTTIQGGGSSTCSCGTLVEFSPNGSGGYRPRILHTFTGGHDGSFPGALTLDSSGNIYATASQGGRMGGVCNEFGGHGCGVVFKETLVGTNYVGSLLYAFTGGADGYNPNTALTFDSAGNLYGGADGTPAGSTGSCNGACGFIYKLTPSGSGTWSESVVYGFTGGTDGGLPNAVTFNASGNMFGTAELYGIPNGCSSFESGCGVAFEIAP